jgi:hypothetical protein
MVARPAHSSALPSSERALFQPARLRPMLDCAALFHEGPDKFGVGHDLGRRLADRARDDVQRPNHVLAFGLGELAIHLQPVDQIGEGRHARVSKRVS